MANPFQKLYSPAAEDADGLVDGATGATSPLTQLLTSAGDGLAHQISVYSGDNIATIVFTITGTDENGAAQSETVTGVNNSTVETTKYFLTVTSITISATLGANTVDIGWLDEFVTPIYPCDHRAGALGLEIVVSGTIDYTVQQTLSRMSSMGTTAPVWADVTAAIADSVDLIGITATVQARLHPPPTGLRLKANSYSTGATLTLRTTHTYN